jgi:hypothetical protein
MVTGLICKWKNPPPPPKKMFLMEEAEPNPKYSICVHRKHSFWKKYLYVMVLGIKSEYEGGGISRCNINAGIKPFLF